MLIARTHYRFGVIFWMQRGRPEVTQVGKVPDGTPGPADLARQFPLGK